MTAILVVNSGSSSIKYQLIEMTGEVVLASGLIERIGEPKGMLRHEVLRPKTGPGGEVQGFVAAQRERFDSVLAIADHADGFRAMLKAFSEHGPSLEKYAPTAIGHRVVHGGARFHAPTIIDAQVLWDIGDLSDLAPLHNPPNLAGIVAAEQAFPDVPHVAIFDTAFHYTLPAPAYTYAIDHDLAVQHRVRRYGFHGTSHKFVSEQTARFLERPLAELKTIVLHLGNGASACAVDGGVSVETSMGMTPLEGLVMGTRSGDIDPAVLVHLHRKAGLDIEQLDELLNRRSGLLGLSGRGDMRDVLNAAASGDEPARLALDVYLHRLKGYVGSYFAQLGHLDAIAFTAGVGENSPVVRAGALAGLDSMGIEVDETRNLSPSREARRISTDESDVAVLVIPTNEELEIARQALQAVSELEPES